MPLLRTGVAMAEVEDVELEVCEDESVEVDDLELVELLIKDEPEDEVVMAPVELDGDVLMPLRLLLELVEDTKAAVLVGEVKTAGEELLVLFGLVSGLNEIGALTTAVLKDLEVILEDVLVLFKDVEVLVLFWGVEVLVLFVDVLEVCLMGMEVSLDVCLTGMTTEADVCLMETVVDDVCLTGRGIEEDFVDKVLVLVLLDEVLVVLAEVLEVLGEFVLFFEDVLVLVLFVEVEVVGFLDV